MKKLVIGIFAHVDAGKTTLAESILYRSGSLKKAGRVDHGDTFLDTHEMERARGITIFSKQALFELEDDTQVTLLDTPGHVDFSTEMERTMQVLDYAILIINGADGVQGHTLTLWRLLKEYEIPAFLFVNKMDQPAADKGCRMAELKKQLDEMCIDFTNRQEEAFAEEIALADEDLMERFLADQAITDMDIAELIKSRSVFPCFFGSALHMEGVDELLEGLRVFCRIPEYPEDFGAKVYKISRDAQGNRLTHLKVTGGALKVKSVITDNGEKTDQIRLYSGERYVTVSEVSAGTICAVTGLTNTRAGQGLGIEPDERPPILEPVLNYRLLLPDGCDAHTMLPKLRQLEEEDPALQILWENQTEAIYASVMGEVQVEILKNLIEERFDTQVSFGEGHIVYKETIQDTVEGVGHFEPLRHYAEVHLLMEPLPRGSGLICLADVSEDLLDLNWQRLIVTHLLEVEHPGVLTGSAITDMKLTLKAGKAHQKHTEGGDFRQAAYRAIRQGLMQADSVLLEPWYRFKLTIPGDALGRAMNDIQRMGGSFSPPMVHEELAVLSGRAPVAKIRDYAAEVMAYTRGTGNLSCMPDGYDVCHNTEEVLAEVGYDPLSDVEHPTGSVFCSHGAGYLVPWDEVKDHMHLESILQPLRKAEPESVRGRFRSEYEEHRYGQEELEEIFRRTYGESKRERYPYHETIRGEAAPAPIKPKKRKKKPNPEEYLLVDGYNVIFAWEDLSELARENIGGARGRLMDILCDYQGYKKCTLILVFDAYRQEGHPEEIMQYHNIYVVYTKEAETADQYIEKTVHQMRPQYEVTVATSDGLEQIIIRGEGARLISARELREEVLWARREIMETAQQQAGESGKRYLFDQTSEELARELEHIRLGKEEKKS